MNTKIFSIFLPSLIGILGVIVFSSACTFGWFKAEGQFEFFPLQIHSQLLVISGIALMGSGILFRYFVGKISKLERDIEEIRIRES